MPFYLCLKQDIFVDVNTLSTLIIYAYRRKKNQEFQAYRWKKRVGNNFSLHFYHFPFSLSWLLHYLCFDILLYCQFSPSSMALCVRCHFDIFLLLTYSLDFSNQYILSIKLSQHR